MVEQRLFNMLVKENEITWKDIIYDLIRKEGMDPWDINVSLLTEKYIETIRSLKEFDFKISGKVILASAILLRIKSKRLVGEDMEEFDRLIKGVQEMDADQFYSDLEGEYRNPKDITDAERMKLIPRTPQARNRKVSIYDLVVALEKALEVKKRRLLNRMPELRFEIPKKKMNISLAMKDVYHKILNLFHANASNITFSKLVDSDTKEDKIFTFIPLLHLDNDRKIELTQHQHVGEISIRIRGKDS